MSAPVTSPFGDRLQERTRPLAPDDAAYGFAHAILCEALSKPFLQVQEVFDPEGDLPPVAPLLDPVLCPDWALPWLAQLVGIVIPTGTAPDTARSLIGSVLGFRRGTRAAMEAAVQVTLIGSKTVYFRERDNGNAYQLEVVTLTAETPIPTQTQAAITATKPAGIVLTYRTALSWDYQQLTIDYGGQTYADLKLDFATYRDLRDRNPVS
jgi:hypothetical protein